MIREHEAGDRAGRLEVVPIRTPADEVPITALGLRARDLAPEVRAVVDALIEAFTPVPVWGRGLSTAS